MELDLLPLSLPGISPERPVVIAGPCSAETEEQVINAARQLSHYGIVPAFGNPAPSPEVLKATARKPCPGCNA